MQPPARKPATLMPGITNNSTKNKITAPIINEAIMSISIVVFIWWLVFQVAHLNGSLLHLSGQLPYTLLQVEDGGGHLVLFLLVGSGVFRTHIFQFLLQLFVALLQLIVFAIRGFGLRGAEIVQLVVGGVVVNDELEIMLLGGLRLCVGSSRSLSWAASTASVSVHVSLIE